jgi:AGZA family xanthine/uracil permease-like MFS transporter
MIMGVYANRPFAVAPYVGENAFIAYTVVRVMGYSWQTALGAVFLAGVLFTILTLLRVRSWLADAIPESLKIAFAVGIGLFLTFIGLNMTGIVQLGSAGAPVRVGNLHSPSVLLAVAGILLMGYLSFRRVNGAILLSILGITASGFLLGLVPLPAAWISLPPDLSPIFLQLDIAGALTWGLFSVILTVFVMGFVDTLGTLIALAMKARLLDARGNLPDIHKPMLADALATTAAALLGTTTTGAYVESATGIEAGGRTGLTAVVTAMLFLLALFFAPALTAVPAFAYGPALILVGLLMVAPIVHLPFHDIAATLPAFMVIVLMSFTYNIGIGMTSGFVIHPLFMVLSGRVRQVRPGMWILCALSMLFFALYPFS